ncbi:MAG: hypothetical protein ACRDPC_15225 [Solirubrobacteraceae bacterium]
MDRSLAGDIEVQVLEVEDPIKGITGERPRTREGCLPFQVKREAKLRAFQFQPDSGFGPEMGEWALR